MKRYAVACIVAFVCLCLCPGAVRAQTQTPQYLSINSPIQSRNLMAYGAKADEREIYDATVSGATLTSATANFTAADNSRTFVVPDGAQGVLYAVYSSGGTVTGTTGQYCTVSGFNGGSGASGAVFLTSTNTISGDVYMSAYGTGYASAPTSATLGSGTATCSGTITLSSAVLQPYAVITTATFVNSTTMTLATGATTNGSSLHVSIGTDNATAIANWTAACEAASQTTACYAPAGQYLTTGTVTINSPITIKGDGAQPLFGSGTVPANFSTDYPTQSPFLNGTVFVEATAGADLFDITVNGAAVNLFDFGMRYVPANAFWNTGNFINATPSATSGGFPVWGMMGFSWNRVLGWGADGNHFGMVVTNAEAGTIDSDSFWGGGGLAWITDSGTCCMGNSVVRQFVAAVGAGGNPISQFSSGVASGASPGILALNLAATPSGAYDNLMYYERPNVGVYYTPSVLPVSNPLKTWNIPPLPPGQVSAFFDNNQRTTTVMAPDLEGVSPIYPTRPNANADFNVIGGNSAYSYVRQWYAGEVPLPTGATSIFAMNAPNGMGAAVPVLQVGYTGGLSSGEATILSNIAPSMTGGSLDIGVGQNIVLSNETVLGFTYTGNQASTNFGYLKLWGDPPMTITTSGWIGINNSTTLPTAPLVVGGNVSAAPTAIITTQAANSSTTPVLQVSDIVANAATSVMLGSFMETNSISGAFPFNCIGVTAATNNCLIQGLHFTSSGSASNYGDIHVFGGGNGLSIWPGSGSNGQVGINTGATAINAAWTLATNGTSEANNFTAVAAASTASAGQINYGGTTSANTNCGTLASSAGCVVINVAGTTHYIPYY